MSVREPAGANSIAGALRALAPYAIAAAIYITVGVWEPRVLLSWAEGILFLLLAVWGIPAMWRRLFR